jgi:hypothetical protein
LAIAGQEQLEPSPFLLYDTEESSIDASSIDDDHGTSKSALDKPNGALAPAWMPVWFGPWLWRADAADQVGFRQHRDCHAYQRLGLIESNPFIVGSSSQARDEIADAGDDNGRSERLVDLDACGTATMSTLKLGKYRRIQAREVPAANTVTVLGNCSVVVGLHPDAVSNQLEYACLLPPLCLVVPVFRAVLLKVTAAWTTGD